MAEANRAEAVEVDALFRRAIAHHRANRLDDAEHAYRGVIARAPDHADAWHRLGVLLGQTERGDDGIAALGRALALDGKIGDAHRNLAALLYRRDRFSDAEPHARRAIELLPNDADAHLTLGLILRKLGHAAAALGPYRRSLALRPDNAHAELSLGNALAELDQFDDATAALRRAIALKPDYALALNNLGNVRIRLGAVDEAIALYRQVVAADAGFAEAHYSLGLALLLKGEFAEGLAKYEWRWRRGGLRPRALKAAVWSLDAPSTARVLVYAEQGQGDVIQFARYVPLVARRARQVIFEVHPALMRLLAGSGEATVVPVGADLPSFDHEIALLSLPRAFGTTRQTVPGDVPYVSAPSDAIARLHARIGSSDALKVGLVWRGSPTFGNDRNRSLDPSVLAPLFELPGVRLCSLQKDAKARDLETLRMVGPIDDLGPELADFADTAGAIMNLDLVISADTAVAHLAGALARPVWLLLPFVPDWRWLEACNDSPWYPTARLFRQASRGDWAGVMARVVAALRDLVGRGRATRPA